MVRDEIALLAESLPILSAGSSGDSVQILQFMLSRYQARRDASIQLDMDGDFGSKTEVAVKDYQKNHNLQADGIVGAQTWLSLCS